MRNFMYKISMFMQGRYGMDQFNIFLLIFSVIFNIVLGFTPVWYLRYLSYITLGYAIFRTLSKNIYKRQRENNKFLKIYTPVKNWFSFTGKKFKDGRTHRYYRCPACKAQLRVKYIKGQHTIKCPKCGYQFVKKIR